MSNERPQNKSVSIVSTKALLEEVIKHPALFSNDEQLTVALKSQGSFARLNDLSRGIYGSSLNTQKKDANNFILGGFAELDRLRTLAREAIEHHNKKAKQSKKRTKSALQQRTNELNIKVSLLEQHNLHLTYIIKEMHALCRSYARDGSESTRAKYRRDMSLLRAKVLSFSHKVILEVEDDIHGNTTL